MRRRRKEIRNERAAIREEFERWRQNNPYATASEFHAKVKQLGSTTPGGSVALPDAHAIQQMAAENQRRKQAEEDERALTQRIRSLQLQEATASMLGNAFTNDPDADLTDVLSSLGMEVNAANVQLAQRAQTGVQTANQKTAEAEAQRQRDKERAEIFNLASTFTGPYYINMSPADKFKLAAETLGYEMPAGLNLPEQTTTTETSAPTAPANDVYGPVRTPPNTGASASASPAPTAPASAISQAPVVVSGRLQFNVDQSVIGIDRKTITPQQLDAIIARESARLTVANTTPEDVEAAFDQSTIVKQLRKVANKNEFEAQLEAARDVKDLFAMVGGQNVGLEAFISTAGNLSGALEGLYIPPGSEAILADVLGGMLVESNDSFTLNRELRKMSSSELQDYILGEIDAAGFVTIEEMKADRAKALMQAPLLDVTEDLFPMLDENLLPNAADVITDAEGFANAKELRDKNIEELEKYKAIALDGRAVDQYALGLYHPADVLPRGELPRYREVMEAYFDKRINELKEINLDEVEKTTKEEDTAAKDMARDLSISESITAVNENPVRKVGAEAFLNMGGFGFDVDLGNVIRREDGEVSLGNPFQRTLLEQQLRGENAAVVASAIKAALLTYLAYDAPMPDATGLGVLTSAAGRMTTNWRSRASAATDAAYQYMVGQGLDERLAAELAKNARNLHSQIFVPDNAPLSFKEAEELLAALDGRADTMDRLNYEVAPTN
jgi:hypothetical protein